MYAHFMSKIGILAQKTGSIRQAINFCMVLECVNEGILLQNSLATPL